MGTTDIINRLGVSVRPVNDNDRAAASTDSQRQAQYIVTMPNGHEYFAKTDKIHEILECVNIEISRV